MADKKKTLAEMIRGSVGEASIAAMDAQSVPNSDTGRDRIEYLPLDKLLEDEKNFYSMNGIEELARNIETVGLLDPLVVRPADDALGSYRIISGHRRRAALEWLAQNGNDLGPVPCIVKRDDASSELQELRLILANSDTRKMCDADIAKQAERVTELLYRLKEQGFEFPGRMIEYVAEACKISRTKISTLKVIRDKLPVEYRAQFEAGEMTTDAAYKLAKMEPELQARICKAYGKAAPTANHLERLEDEHKKRHGCTWTPELTCPDGKPCTHGDAFLRHDAGCYLGETCGGKKCCLTCDRASRDWSPCGSACVQAKKARTEKNAERKKREETQREKEQAKLRREIQTSLKRLLPLVDAAGLKDSERLTVRYNDLTVKQLRAYVAGDFGDKHFYGNSFDVQYAQGETVVKLAKQLHCTTDFLLGLTDEPTPRGASDSDTQSADTRKCVTGLSKSGQCGAASCCSKSYTCCIACDDPCNLICGWLPQKEAMKPQRPAPQWEIAGPSNHRQPMDGGLYLTYQITNDGYKYRPALYKDGVGWCDPGRPSRELTGWKPLGYIRLPRPGEIKPKEDE